MLLSIISDIPGHKLNLHDNSYKLKLLRQYVYMPKEKSDSFTKHNIRLYYSRHSNASAKYLINLH